VSRLNDNGSDAAAHVLRSDVRPRMAKAELLDVRKADIDQWKAQIGQAIRETRGAFSLKEFADLIARDERQVSRWEKGDERPQLDAIFTVPAFRGPLIVALAELAHDIEVITEIRIRRRTVA
jgi:DNA-binding transcriptional regulator YiaG